MTGAVGLGWKASGDDGGCLDAIGIVETSLEAISGDGKHWDELEMLEDV